MLDIMIPCLEADQEYMEQLNVEIGETEKTFGPFPRPFGRLRAESI